VIEEIPSSTSSDDSYIAFVRRSWQRNLTTARLLTGDPHRAEELLQDCLVKLYQRWRRVSRFDDPQAYLYRMLVNGNLSRWRRGSRELLVAESPERAAPQTQPHLPDEALRTALLTLSPRQRAVVVLRHYADLSEKETAAALKCSVGAVKAHQHRALARLRDLLSETHMNLERVIR